MPAKVLLIDNYDSFTWNLVQGLRMLGADVIVRRNDTLDAHGARALAPTHLVISPGPGTPREAGCSAAVVEALAGEIPVLGVCLGHQCIGQAYGGRVVRARRPMHGRTSLVRHVGEGVFSGLPNPLQATRYHSLVVLPDGLPETLVATAYSEEGEIMALRHREHPVVGVQFHPEAVLTEHGHDLLRNFLSSAL